MLDKNMAYCIANGDSIRHEQASEKANERKNDFFINEGKGISTIYFFSSSPRALDRERERQRGGGEVGRGLNIRQ